MNIEDTVAGRIARLDAALLRKGFTATLKRRSGTTSSFVSTSVRISTRGYAPHEFVNGVDQRDSEFIMSPTEITADAAWPGAAGGGDLPRKDDVLVINGGDCAIQAVRPILVGGSVVRIVGRVRGP